MMKNRNEEWGVRAGWVATKSGNLLSNKPDAVRVGWVECSDTQQRYATITPGDGYRCAPPILRVPTQSAILAPRSSKGFSLISAIFLLVVIAALGTFAVTLSTTQQQSAALDVMGARGYQAARAGIDWGAYQVLQNGGACAATTTLPAMTGTLSAFAVIVACVPTAHSEAAATVTVYQLTSTATRGTAATPDYVERQITATIAQ